MSGGVTLSVRLFGIDIRVERSWILVFFFFSWIWSAFFGKVFAENAPGLYAHPAIMGWVASSLLAILLFMSVIVHELAHSLFARRLGCEVGSVSLFALGEMSRIEESFGNQNALKDFGIAGVGPLSSSILAGLLWLILNALDGASNQFSVFVFRVTEQLVFLNLVLAIFNAFPIYPVDGGRMLVAGMRFFGVGKWRARFIGVRVGLVGSALLIIVATFFLSVLLIFIGVFLALENRREFIRLKREKALMEEDERK